MGPLLCYKHGEKMNKLMEFGRATLTRFLNLLVVVVLVAVLGVFVVANGIMVTNLVNQWQTGMYVNVTFGVQAVLVFLGMVGSVAAIKEYVRVR
jgi:hypothetical protein